LVVVYVIDTQRTQNPSTFMSNMLYACSILYKTKLPFIVAFNKIDVVPHTTALEWMNNYEAFQDALDNSRYTTADTRGSYMSSLTRSMSLVLDEFYSSLTSVGVSAMTGEGMDDLFEAIGKAAKEYDEFYLPDLLQRQNEAKGRKQVQQEKEFERVKVDIAKSHDASGSSSSFEPENKMRPLTAAKKRAEMLNERMKGLGLKEDATVPRKQVRFDFDEEGEQEIDDAEDEEQEVDNNSEKRIKEQEDEFENEEMEEDFEEETRNEEEYELLKNWLQKQEVSKNVSQEKAKEESTAGEEESDEI
jgi:hypothetical protein